MPAITFKTIRTLVVSSSVLGTLLVGCGSSLTTKDNTGSTTATLQTPVISWAPPTAISYGVPLGSAQLNAVASAPGTLVYSPSAGTLLKAGSQTLSVSFTPNDPASFSSVTKSVQIDVTQAVPDLSWANPSAITFGTSLSSSQLNATSSVTGSFTYTPANGALLAAGTHSLSVTFSPTDAVDYVSVTKAVQLTIAKATPILSWDSPADIAVNTPLSAQQLDATAAVPGSFIYTPSIGSVLQAGVSSLSVVFTPTDQANYATSTKTVQISVNKLVPDIAWTNPDPITYGTSLSGTQLNATSSVAGAFTYSPILGTLLNAGNNTLSVTFTPADSTRYATTTKSVSVHVDQATPILSWSTPAATPLGIALSSEQLSATASVAGTFVYSPDLGSVLPLGVNQLTVNFTPTDPNYSTAAGSTSIVVGHTYYVSGSGSDSNDGTTSLTPFRTLQKAADKTVAGDFVYVMNGTYTSNSYIILKIANAGTEHAWITYQVYPGHSPIISESTGKNWDAVRFMGNAAYVEFSGFTVIGNNSNVTLTQAQTYQKVPGSHPEINGSCISVNGRSEGTHPTHIRILRNVVGECGGGGITALESDYVTVSGNTVYNSAWYTAYGASAISFLNEYDSNPADTATKYKMVITGNKLYGNQEFIPWVNVGYISDGEAIIIDSNLNSSYTSKISFPPYTGRTLIANNVAHNTGSDAIEVFHSAHVDIVNNSTYGDVLTPVESGRGELNLNTASDVNVFNNIFYSRSGQNPITAGKSTQCTIDYNIYYNGSNILGGLKSGDHDLYVDPQYVAPDATPLSAVNLKIASGSAAIGSGTSDLAPSSDIDGKPRSSDTGFDRGAYQH